MRKTAVLTLLLMLAAAAGAQQLVVASPLVADSTQKKTVSAWVGDYNGDICALVKVRLEIDDAQFEGDIVKLERIGRDYWLWMSQGARWVTILSASHTPLRVDFKPLKSAVVYTLGIDVQYELVVADQIHADPMSTDAVKFSVSDPRSHKPCALVRMGFVADSVEFEGNVVDKVFKNGEWWLWLSPGTTALVVKHPGYAPLHLSAEPLQSSTTYLATIRVPVIIVQGDNPYQGRWFLMANYAYAFAPDHAFGLTVGRVGRFGWYLNLMTNASFTFSGDASAASGDGLYIWDGRRTSSRLSATAGGMLALGRFGYLYAGVGYGVRTLVGHTRSGQAIELTDNSYNGLALEGGLVFRLSDHMLLSAGYSTIEFGKYSEVKLGVGYKF